MTMLPELERQLVRASALHYSDRRSFAFRRMRQLARPVLAVGLTVGAVLVVVVGVGTRASPETALPTSQAGRSMSSAATQVAHQYRVFDRPRSSQDDIAPINDRVVKVMQRPGVALNLRESRLVARNDAYRYYAVPASSQAGASLCILALDDTGAGAGGGCGNLAEDSGSTDPLISTTTRPGNRQEAFFLLPDDIANLHLDLRDGRRIDPPIADNAVLLTLDSGVASARWTDSRGSEHQRVFHNDPADDSD